MPAKNYDIRFILFGRLNAPALPAGRLSLQAPQSFAVLLRAAVASCGRLLAQATQCKILAGAFRSPDSYRDAGAVLGVNQVEKPHLTPVTSEEEKK